MTEWKPGDVVSVRGVIDNHIGTVIVTDTAPSGHQVPHRIFPPPSTLSTWRSPEDDALREALVVAVSEHLTGDNFGNHEARCLIDAGDGCTCDLRHVYDALAALRGAEEGT